MISGKPRGTRRAWLLAPFLIAGSGGLGKTGRGVFRRAGDAPEAEPQPAEFLAQLMHRLAGVAASRASFREVKQIRALTRPLQSSGRLIYVRPSYLAMITLQPAPEKLVIDGDRLFISEDNAPARVIDLAEQPAIAALVETIRGTLSGDLASLRHSFTVGVEGGPDAWRLTLVPASPAIAHFLRQVVIAGSGATLTKCRFVQANGDETRITIDGSS